MRRYFYHRATFNFMCYLASMNTRHHYSLYAPAKSVATASPVFCFLLLYASNMYFCVAFAANVSSYTVACGEIHHYCLQTSILTTTNIR